MRPRLERPDRSDFTLLEAEELCDIARPRPGGPDRSDFILLEAEELCNTARPRPGGPDRSELSYRKQKSCMTWLESSSVKQLSLGYIS